VLPEIGRGLYSCLFEGLTAEAKWVALVVSN